MARSRSRYPGGPRREGASDAQAGAGSTPRLHTVGELEAGRGRRSRARERRRRVRRVWSGLVLAVTVSAGVGLFLGLRSHRTSEQITDERNDTRAQQQELTRETNRVLLELWRMEDVEKRATPP